MVSPWYVHYVLFIEITVHLSIHCMVRKELVVDVVSVTLVSWYFSQPSFYHGYKFFHRGIDIQGNKVCQCYKQVKGIRVCVLV